MLFCAPAAEAQSTGTVTGTVVDAGTGEPLDGVDVSITILDLLDATDAQGRFIFHNVPPGAYELRVELIGYPPVTRAISVVGGDTLTVTFRMELPTLFLEEMVVTGTALKESPVNLPYAVSVVGREKMAEQGSPQAVDFFKNLGASHGVIGEANSWYNDQSVSVPETVANVNLRGLGASRTLVLINSRRQVYIPARLFGGRFVDVNAIPSIAVDRVEVLKEGASAIYGSDAVAGVANFLTRGDFVGFEVTAAHDQFAGAGDSNAGAIWGRKIGESHAVVSAEWMGRQELNARERTWTLRGFPFWGWSGTGNPGAFLMPSLTGDEDKDEFVQSLVDAPRFIDPNCEDLGGHAETWTCRFRYQPWDILIEKQRHIRTFAELNGPLGDDAKCHLELMWADAYMPHYSTTPSFPPITLFNGNQVVGSGNPGRQAFCASSYEEAGFDSPEACLMNDWYFFGRLVGNEGPGRSLSRQSRTSRVAASITRDLQIAGRHAQFDFGVSYSSSSGNMNQPAEYAYRKFLAFRGYGGPNCGVGVVADPTAPQGMRLGPLNGKVAGQGNCVYYNPFSNAIRTSTQAPDGLDPSAFTLAGKQNPDYVPGLENSPSLIAWINEESNLENDAALLVADATLSGTLREDVWLDAGYAAGYQFRRLDVSAQPNKPADLSINPCLVPGDRSCIDETGRYIGFGAGPFTLTNGHFPYEEQQGLHRLFGEIRLGIGPRLDAQVVANYEFHRAHSQASSFNPKVAARLLLSETPTHSLSLRSSLQTTFRTPSVDDLNTDVRTTLEYLDPVGVYKAVDAYGNTELEPEEAFTYNLGLVFFAEPDIDITLDYWRYDFKDVIATLPQNDVVRLYGEGYDGDATKLNAVMDRVSCPGDVTDGSCAPGDIERVRIDLINWPGVRTSGFDWRLGARVTAGRGKLSGSLDGTYTREYFMKALRRDGVEYRAALNGAGYYNRTHPLASPIPRWKWRGSAGYHRDDYSVIGYLNFVSAYEDRDVWTLDSRIDRFLTLDVNLVWRMPRQGMIFTLSALNLTSQVPPLVDFELGFDGLTHNPKGRRIKLAATCTLGG